jgi:hypothetical protein
LRENLLLYSSKPSLGVYQLADHFTLSTLPIKFSGTIITAPSVCEYNSKMNSRLCPWLLTWPDFGDDYEEDDEEYDDAGVN